MIPNKDVVDTFFKLLGQGIDAVKLHKQPNLIYNVDETGFRLIYISGNQEVLAVKGNGIVHTALHGNNTVTVMASMKTSGGNAIPPSVSWRWSSCRKYL
jgi:hypothetical protein